MKALALKTDHNHLLSHRKSFVSHQRYDIERSFCAVACRLQLYFVDNRLRVSLNDKIYPCEFILMLLV